MFLRGMRAHLFGRRPSDTHGTLKIATVVIAISKYNITLSVSNIYRFDPNGMPHSYKCYQSISVLRIVEFYVSFSLKF